MADAHPIFDEIARGDLEAVQQRVLADPSVLDERGSNQRTPLMYAIRRRRSAIARLIIDQVRTGSAAHDLRSTDSEGKMAMDHACEKGAGGCGQTHVHIHIHPRPVYTPGPSPQHIHRQTQPTLLLPRVLPKPQSAPTQGEGLPG